MRLHHDDLHVIVDCDCITHRAQLRCHHPLARDVSQCFRHVHVPISSQAEGHLAGLVTHDRNYSGAGNYEWQLSYYVIGQFTLAILAHGVTRQRSPMGVLNMRRELIAVVWEFQLPVSVPRLVVGFPEAHSAREVFGAAKFIGNRLCYLFLPT